MILTANKRLARELRHAHDVNQLESGRQTWPAADILPLSGWLERSWREWLYSAPRDFVHLLRPSQERVVWEELIARDASGLIEADATAKVALDAWNLLCSWHIPLDAAEWSDSDDAQVFQGWAREFEALCRARDWLSGGRLAGFIADRLEDGSLQGPRELTLAGFNELTPAEAHLKASLERSGSRVIEKPALVADRRDHAWRYAALDRSTEIGAAAEWCREYLGAQLEERPRDASGLPIGVVVPDLAAYRSEIERVFARTLCPSGSLELPRDSHQAFNISIGQDLSDYPIVREALQVLRLNPSSISLEDASRLLRSPFVGSLDERSARGVLDRKIRRFRERQLGLDMLIAQSLEDETPSHCPGLARNLERWRDEWVELVSEQEPSAWARSFSELLHAIGWPGDRPLTSSEFQTKRAWNDCLSELACLDPMARRVDLISAVSMLDRVVSAHLFQPESQRAPIQILGLLEASGLEFSRLWIMGMHDGAWPRSRTPNPFLPLRLQRQRNLPRSSAAKELEFAELMTLQLLASAPQVLVSYPEREGEEELRPSPLVATLPLVKTEGLLPNGVPGVFDELQSNGAIETLDDEQAPAWEGTLARGGTAIFRHQAACPFRAFAVLRLGAEPLKEARDGLDAIDRGNLVHEILTDLWIQLGSYARLRAIERSELDQLVSKSIGAALRSLSARRKISRRSRLLAIEGARLEQMLDEWLGIERNRQSFTVLQSDERRRVEIGGLDIEVRADRVDRLEDGSLVIVDYKTGEHRPSEWEGSRPEEPQVPLYAATVPGPVSGVFFGILKTGKTGFRGFATSDGIVPGAKVSIRPVDETVQSWRAVLERLGGDFRDGVAAVDPVDPPKTCRYCALPALCRINETVSLDAELNGPANG